VIPALSWNSATKAGVNLGEIFSNPVSKVEPHVFLSSLVLIGVYCGC
jgi:hypothetical protein